MGDDSLNVRRLRSRDIRIRPDPRLEKKAKERDDEDRDEISEGDDESRDVEYDKEEQEGSDEEERVDDEDGSDDCSQKYYATAREGLEEMKHESSFDTSFVDKRPTSNVDKKCDSEKSSYSFSILMTIAIIGAILSILLIYIFISFIKTNKTNIVDHHRERLLRWEKSFDDLVTKYGTALPEISRKVIDKSVRSVLKRRTPSEQFNALEPAIILLLGSKFNSQGVKCIYQKLSQSISEAYNETQAPVIDVINFSKLELGGKFHETFSKGLHCIVLDGIERLDGNTALSLHTFTDHDKAPYLDIIIFLTAYTDNRLTNTSLQIQQIDTIANNVLEVSWSKNLPIEQVAGLLSRVTPSVAIISDTNSSQNWLCE